MKFITLILLAFILIGCSKQKNPEPNNGENVNNIPNKNLAPDIKIPELKKYFDDVNMKGCMVIWDYTNNKFAYYDSARCHKEFLPASTFKIPNSLISLEAGVIKDEEEYIKWDGKVRSREEWNTDANLRTAFKNSTVWFYQELARRVGEKKMQHYIDTLDYGNKNISGGIDMFWLNGSIRITAMQQIFLLRNIFTDKVPFSQRSIDILKKIMILEETPKYTMRGKTGTAIDEKKIEGGNVGWFVGYLTRENNIYFFALNVDITNDNILYNERINLPRKVFNDMGVTEFEMK